jgi:hypothetical protein
MELGVRVVLLRPQDAQNVGSAARALRNFGLSDWAWVNPAFADLEPARRLAVHAGELLSTARVSESLDAIVADCVWVVGTSSRHVTGKRRVNPRQAAREMVERCDQGRVALVFGDERHPFDQLDPADRVATDRASEAVPAAGRRPDMQVWPALIVVEGASSDQRLSLATKLDAVAGNDLLDRMCELEGLGMGAVSDRGVGRALCRHSTSPPCEAAVRVHSGRGGQQLRRQRVQPA